MACRKGEDSGCKSVGVKDEEGHIVLFDFDESGRIGCFKAQFLVEAHPSYCMGKTVREQLLRKVQKKDLEHGSIKKYGN